MNREEILEEINKTKEHLTNMEKMLESYNGKWKPQLNEVYYSISPVHGDIIEHIYKGSKISDNEISIGNCFRTHGEGEKALERLEIRNKLEDIVIRLNKGKIINWEKCSQNKYFLCYDYRTNNILQLSTGIYSYQGVVYCLDEDFKDIAIKEIGEERLTRYLKGNR